MYLLLAAASALTMAARSCSLDSTVRAASDRAAARASSSPSCLRCHLGAVLGVSTAGGGGEVEATSTLASRLCQQYTDM